MKKILLIGFTGLLFTGTLFSQNFNVPSISVDAPDLNTLAIEDAARDKNGQFYRVATYTNVDIDIFSKGYWYTDENGNMVGTLQIESENALGLCLSLDQFEIPEGAEVRLYNPETNILIGPYTSSSNITEGDEIITDNVTGDKLTLEIILPKEIKGNTKLHIGKVYYFYRNIDFWPETNVSRDFGESQSCEVNVNCSEGSSWQNQIGGACRILVTDAQGSGWCSGTLINNTGNDCTPYVLTAQHCGAGGTATHFRSWRFDFRYESSGCSTPGTEPSKYSVTGSLKLSSSGTISDVQKSDYLLVLLKTRPVSTATAYYNGWNRSASVSGGGVGIHHPAGDIKKISKYNNTPTSSTWSGGTPNAHWRVNWVSTTNGHGVTEGGSSGSPLFNSSGQIIGDLSGGSSFCNSPNSPDLYGKFAYSWNSCGSTPQLQLAPWLDRTGTAAMNINGVAQTSCVAGTLPVVDFFASNPYPVVNTETVILDDATTNNPFIWQWTIAPATFTYVNGTNQYSENPQVQFTAVGTYTVNLYAGNVAGYNNKIKNAYIKVGNLGLEDENTPSIVMYPNPVNEMLYINLGNNAWDMEKLTVTIMDLSGKLMLVENASAFNGTILSVNIPAGISNGFYFVKVSDGKNSTTEKLEIVR